MNTTQKASNRIIDGNQACADVAYRLSEISAIYPITPSSPMGEHADEWSAAGRKNIWGFVPEVVELQSEGGASGTLHGTLQTGALATTYTASQGLLLMLPNMYKIAGELTPAVMHVAARSLAVQALSIFGDHGDVMAVRSAGWVLLASGSVQEAHDMAAIAHAATLEACLPFVHFFDGFRVSHEINTVSFLTDDNLRALVNDDLIFAHRARALNPETPFIRGTSQNPDVYFQARETVNQFYNKVPEIVAKVMDKFTTISGRKYSLMDYYGDPNAERVIVLMGSGAVTARETAKLLQGQGEKIGVVQVRLYRPFASEHFLNLLPKAVKAIAVLDRTKESNALGEPLYQDVVTAFVEANVPGKFSAMPKIIGGRYGLSSKEFTPGMVQAVFAELKNPSPKTHFTIGINDDVTNLSLEYVNDMDICCSQVKQAIFYGLGADGTVSANKNSIKIIGDATNLYTQAYFVYDSKKSGSQTVSHLRFGPEPIAAPYLIENADFIACHQLQFLAKIDVLSQAKPGATFLLNSPYDKDKVWEALPREVQEQIVAKKLKFYVIDAYKVARKAGLQMRINTVMQVGFFALIKLIPIEEAITKIKAAVAKTYGGKGEEIVKQNYAAIDQSLASLEEVKVPDKVSTTAKPMPAMVSAKAPEFVQNVIVPIMKNKGDDLKVSQLPADGTYPCGTTKWEKRNVANFVAGWNPELCIQCGQCAFVCPHAVIRSKRYDKALLKDAPEGFKSAPPKVKKDGQDEAFTLQVSLEDCTGCGLCNAVCPAKNKKNPSIKAIMLVAKEPILEQERANVEFFNQLPYVDRDSLNKTQVRDVQFLEPLFEFSGACAGCGETPYLSLLTRLYGDHLLVANATGCSSIYGGNLPTTPWSCNKDGYGPAWSNSLFEDNAEFGFGFRLTLDQHRKQALQLLEELKPKLDANLVKDILANLDAKDAVGIAAQRTRVKILREKLQQLTTDRARQLNSLVENLIAHSVWLVGGDGWAYDIGYGGLDHVLAQNRNVKVLVLDTEVYSNTGGQSSKATPLGAVAKFAAAGKGTPRKDIGMMMMAYDNIYVAQVASGANPMQTLRAFEEAEKYDGPAIIIAYSHCIAHGYNLQKGPSQQKLAVDSGFWPLYRYNPALREQGKNPLQLDSKPPSIPIADFMYNEPRFKVLLETNKERADMLLKEAEAWVKQKWVELEKKV